MDTTSTSGAQAAEQMQTGASGYDAAQQPQTPAATAAPSAGGGPPTAVPAGGAQAPASPGAAPAAAQPTVITPVKRGGLLGVVDGIADVLAGKTRPEIAKDQDGNAYVKNVSLSRGEQWERIGAEAFTGAMKGMAAGKGAGNLGKAGAAGVDQGEEMAKQRQQQEKDMTAEARQQTLDNANRQMLTMKQTEQAWQANRNQIEATQHDIEFSQKQEDRLTKPIAEGGEGGQVLGIMHGPDDLRHILKVDPNVMDALVKKGTIRTPYHIGPDGKIDGMTVIKMPDDYGKEVVPTGTEFPTWNSVTQGYDWHKTAAGQVTTKRDIDNYWDAAGVKGLDERNKVAEIHQKEEAAKESDAKIANAPGEAAHTRAETRQANAGAAKDDAERRKIETDSGQNAEGAALIDSIGTGKIALDRLGYLAARNPDLLASVVRKYPDFDSTKAASYLPTYKEFTSTKPGTAGSALNAGATALKHLHELSELNTVKSHIYGTADYTAYQNKADTLSTELARFYGDSTVPAIANIKKTLASTLPGNRQAAIATQAKSMGDKFDAYEQTWKNAAPSAAYEAPMPGIDPAAQAARAALDPDYAKREVAKTAAGAPVTVQPGEPTAKAADGSTLVVRNGAWVPAQPH
jgi:hypothetical protein